MAAPTLLQTLRLRPCVRPIFTRHSSSSSFSDIKKNCLNFLERNFTGTDMMLSWGVRWKLWRLRNKNKYYSSIEVLYGKPAAAAFYALSLNGGIRFFGRQEWIRPNDRGRIKFDFLSCKDAVVEGVDLSHSDANYYGLDNILELRQLRYLNLSHCPYIDDWCLSRLYMFGLSLEVLVLAGCPQVTERGLATLHHLQKLKYLDISDLPNVTNKGFTRILLEEVLPECEVVGVDYTDGLQREEISAQPEVS